MKKRISNLQILTSSQSGFTLIELMVAVGIVGVLASMAVPSFRKYKVIAARAEAKLHMRTIDSLAKVAFSTRELIPPSSGFGSSFYGPSMFSASVSCDEDLKQSIGFSVGNCNKLRYRYYLSYEQDTNGKPDYGVNASASSYTLGFFGDVKLGNPPVLYNECHGNDQQKFSEFIRLDDTGTTVIFFDATKVCK